MNTKSRVPAGVPTGGQFAAGARAEASNVIVLPLGRRVIPTDDGDRVFTGEQSGSTTFDEVVLRRGEAPDTFTAIGRRKIDLRRAVMDYVDDTPAGAERWLDEHAGTIEEHIGEAYGADLTSTEGAERNWSAQRIEASFDLGINDQGDPLKGAVRWMDTRRGSKALARATDADIAHGLAQAVIARTEIEAEHADGVHDEWPGGIHPECPDCLAHESRLLDLADEMRKNLA